MEITLNGQPRTLPDPCTAAQLIELLALGGKRIAMEVNQDIVPRSQYTTHRLQHGDRVEIVHAVGGG